MKNATHLLMVVDRSGSMDSVKDDAQGAVNTFLREQKELDGECNLTFVQFDAHYADNEKKSWYEVVYDGPIAKAKDYHLVPRGGTALNDAIGKSVTDLGKRFSDLSEDERPNNVIVIIQTDGGENSSRDWSHESVRDLITQQQDQYNWSFVFLGMGPDTWGTGAAYGINNNIRATGTAQSYGSTYATASHAVTMSRITGQTITGLDEDTK